MKYLKFFPFYLLSIIPLRVLYILSDFMYLVVYHVMKYRRAVVQTNLKNSFPHKSLTEITAIEKRFYKHFCDTAFESIKVLTLGKKAINQRFNIKNTPLIESLHKDNKSIILYTSHYGNWNGLASYPYSYRIRFRLFTKRYPTVISMTLCWFLEVDSACNAWNLSKGIKPWLTCNKKEC